MNDIKLKPFDLAAAQRGEPVITRNGEPYKFGAYNPDAEKGRQILGWCNKGDYYSHSSNGRYCYDEGQDSDLDLFMAPQKKELWIAVRSKAKDGVHHVTCAFPTEEGAKGDFIDSSDCQIIKITIQQ